MDHVKDLFIQLIAALVVWKASAFGLPITETGAHELALVVVGLIGKLQKSPIPSLAPQPASEQKQAPVS